MNRRMPNGMYGGVRGERKSPLLAWEGGVRLIDEDVSRRTIAVSIKATKLTGRVLAQACLAAGRKIAKAPRARPTPHGQQTVRQLMGPGATTNRIEGESPKDFDRVARKWNVDYGITSSRRSSRPNPQAESAKRRPFALCTFALSQDFASITQKST